SVIDLDYDGTADLLVLFRDGQPVFSRRAAPLPARTANRDLPAPHQGDVSGLPRLTDPFESGIPVRPVPLVPPAQSALVPPPPRRAAFHVRTSRSIDQLYPHALPHATGDGSRSPCRWPVPRAPHPSPRPFSADPVSGRCKRPEDSHS